MKLVTRTREQCIAAAAQPLARAFQMLDGTDGSTVQEAARAALTPGGPSLDELIVRIRKRRGLPDARAA